LRAPTQFRFCARIRAPCPGRSPGPASCQEVLRLAALAGGVLRMTDGNGDVCGREASPLAPNPYFSPLIACAWIAVIATVLTMSGTVQPRLRSLTGLRSPCSTGPTAIAPAERCTAL